MTKATPIQQYSADWLSVSVWGTAADAGRASAESTVAAVRETIAAKGECVVGFATGIALRPFADALESAGDPGWDKVDLFHLDEFLYDSPDSDSIELSRWARDFYADRLGMRRFYPFSNDASKVETQKREFTRLLAESPPDLYVVGIGENCHIGFNEPPAPFWSPDDVEVRELNPDTRESFVRIGRVERLADAPYRGLTITMPAIMRAPRIIVIATDDRKAEAIRNTVAGPIGFEHPSTALRLHPAAELHVDPASHRLLADDALR